MGKVFTLLVLIVAIAVAGFLGNVYLHGDSEPPAMRDGWWGRGKPEPETDLSISKVVVNIPNGTLTDLRRRLDNSRLGEDLQETDFHYGFQVNYMKEVLQYWKTTYDWREQEKKINQFDHYRTKIEGIDVHFMRSTPANAKAAKPIMLVHGWPGSIWEFHKMIPMLTDPTKHGGSEDDAFDVICPCIPGYGFSEAPHRQGFSAVAAARIFVKLMKRLGYEQFYYQGGDWGSLIGQIMAQAYPENVKGLHLNNFTPNSKSLSYNVRLVVGSFFPSLAGVTEAEAKQFYPLSKLFGNLLAATGYMHLQSTRPDTVAFGLNDSPVGLAAYILEKFGSATNLAFMELPDGGLTRKFSMDDLLTNVMIYWVTGSIGSSMRFYKENTPSAFEWDSVPVTVPAGLAGFEHEMVAVPRVFAESKFLNIVQCTFNEDVGHFAALEAPARLTKDVRSFVRIVEEMSRKPKHHP